LEKESKRFPMNPLRRKVRILVPIVGDLFADRDVAGHCEKNRYLKKTTGCPVMQEVFVPAGLVVEEPKRRCKRGVKIFLLSGHAQPRRSMTWEQKEASISCASWRQLEPERASVSGLFFGRSI
jgi:hypothetical protein